MNAYGCDVIGYDVVDKTMPGTRLKAFINSGDDNAADMTKALTRGRGVDKVIITAATNSNAPMDLAAAIARDRGIICMIGVTQMNIDRRPYYERELSFRIARSYGAGRYDSTYEQKGMVTRLAMCVLQRVATLKSLCVCWRRAESALQILLLMRFRLKKRQKLMR